MRHARRRRRALRPEAARAIVVFLVLGVCIYIALATTAGTWIAEKVVAPVLRLFNREESPADTPSEALMVENAGEDSSASLSVSPPEPSEDSSQEEISVEAFSVYAVQLGAFSSLENAEKQADEMRSRGAGCYIYQDEHYRVLSSVYLTMEDAKAVRDKLISENNVEAAVYTIEGSGALLRVTASEELLSQVKSAFSLLEGTCAQLYEVCSSLDTGKISEEQARSQLRAISQDAQTLSDSLQSVAQNDIGEQLTSLLSATASYLNTLADSGSSGTEFSALAKYEHVRYACSYAKLLKQISASL